MSAAGASSAASAKDGKGVGGGGPSGASLPAGYAVAQSAPFTATAGMQTRGTVTCPGTTRPLSGGAVVSSTSLSVNLNSSFPITKNTWAVDVNNASATDTTFTVYAVCVKRPASGFTVNTQTFTVPAHSQVSGTTACPSGVVVGGGVQSSSGNTTVNINSLEPSSTTGWRADMNDAMALGSSMTVYAICKNTKPGNYSVQFSSATPNPNNAQTSVSVNCPGTSVPLAGGAFSSSSNTATNLNETVPVTHGWLDYENNASGADAVVTAVAICAGR